jgi:hypothetical protein
VRPLTAPAAPRSKLFPAMLRLLLYSPRDLRPELAATVIGRQAVELYRVKDISDLRLLASTLDPQAILVDRDVDDVRGLIETLRKEPATRARSLAVLAHGDFQPWEVELLEAGANAILRLPPGGDWDERLARLLRVPVRQDGRLPVHFAMESEPECGAEIVNLSARGMLLAPRGTLAVHDSLRFRFTLPDGAAVAGEGRVVRMAEEDGCGVEFSRLSDAARSAIEQYLRSARLG